MISKNLSMMEDGLLGIQIHSNKINLNNKMEIVSFQLLKMKMM
jgi:hypothetical protein